MKIIALTGAGISKQSHIPTFMERPDVREKLFRSYAKRHPEEYNEVIQQLKANMNGAKPNDAHLALAEYKIPIITMNIDGLHRLAGSDALTLEKYRELFGENKHEFTGVDYVQYYSDIITEAGAEVEIIFANRAQEIIKYTDCVLS